MKIINKYQREEYVSRINDVFDYIEKNIHKELTLDKISAVACFSSFHFHRIFHSIVGETLNQFIKRVRIEKAATILSSNPKKSITEVAFDCGFSGSATFARSFKEHFRVSASEWRKNKNLFDNSKNCKTKSKKRKTLSKKWKDLDEFKCYFDDVVNNYLWRTKMKNNQTEITVEVKKIEEIHLAYLRHIGPYKGDEGMFERMFTKIMKWGGSRNLLNFPETKSISVYHDNPEITDESKLRTSIGISVPADTQTDGEIGKMTLEAGEYAVAHFEVTAEEYAEAWATLYGHWLPTSGYQPDDKPSFELYLNDPSTHPEGKHIVDIYLPVKPL